MLLATVLASVLAWRKVHREFPWFAAYVTSSILIAAIRLSFLLAGSYQAYFKIYWGTEAIYAVLALFALHEIFREVFLSFYVYRWFWLLFPGVSGLALLISVIYAIEKPPVPATRIVNVILSGGIAVNVIEGMLFLLLFGLAGFFHLRWRNHPLGIAGGFAIVALGTGLSYWIRSTFGTEFASFAKYSAPVAYILAVVLWLDTFLRSPEQERQWMLSITPQRLLEEIHRYNEILDKLRKKLR